MLTQLRRCAALLSTNILSVPGAVQYDSYAFEGKRWKLVGVQGFSTFTTISNSYQPPGRTLQ
jgi:hypothetical protein